MEITRYWIVVLALLVASSALASDLAKEARWAEQVVDALLDGEAVWLEDGRGRFLALDTESGDGSVGKAAVIMHGTGVHPNWATVVQPLRVGLTESGWRTLSIQMPVLANEAAHADYAGIYDWVPGRIDAAVAHLRTGGAEKVVLIAHSQGSTMAVYHLSRPHRPVDGLVAVGISGGIEGGPMDTLQQLPGVGLPILDLYGSDDLVEVLDSTAARSRSAGGEYTQRRIEGADHFFDGEEDELLDAVNAWLNERF